MHYSFNGQIIATRRGTTLSYLHVDHLSSNNLATSSSGTQTASRTYYAYGTEQPGGTGTLPTDRTFTGQKQDGTGLIYLNARYYDPTLGTFLSPDTLVPDAGRVFDYNRFAYARLNPLKYTDPSGHCAVLEDGSRDGSDQECWDLADSIYNGWDGDADYWNQRFGSKDIFMNQIAVTTALNKNFMQWQLDQYWSAFYQRTGVHHARYNPAPTWDEPPPHPIEGIADAITPYATLDCNTLDCMAIAMDIVSLTGSVILMAPAATCGPMAPGCVVAARTVSYGVPALSLVWTGYRRSQEQASNADVAVTMTTTVVGVMHPNPRVGAGAAAAQLIWDSVISPHIPR